MNSLRLFFVGGLISYRALFGWLSPWILIPTFLFAPLFQIFLFVYIGRTAGVSDDRFFLIGNAVVNAAVPCLFAMGNTIGGERNAGTLPLLIASPAKRVPLFLGRALPVILNGFLVAVFALVVGALLLRVDLPPATWGGIAVAIAACSISCTGLGLLGAAVALRVRETAVMSNIVLGTLIVFAGVNVPVGAMPGWMQGVAQWLPMTHGIHATHDLAAGRSLGSVSGALLTELLLGAFYATLGLALLRWLEWESRARATLDTA
ncbi:ABC-2 type transport system permease protein [Asanoa hainanensis]|uniref:Transport permease protein n=1 Tax=Asanoa hainanensis TaxID=560556 RepID=A0A239IVT5_9ACTN|nr:ABC transporter permease [Asanoa hainanensis]SNS97727.1 ABC-2 type transport system permease protein [Asanoa hainanensis]